MRRGIDFLRGVFLIGATPTCVLGVLLLGLRFRSGEVSEAVAAAIVPGAIAATSIGIALAVWHRIRKRAIPLSLIWLEAVLGLLSAMVFLLFESLMFRSIDNMSP